MGDQRVDDPSFVARIDPLLRGLFRTAQPVATLPVPGAMAREIALDAAIEHRALVLVAGGDGEALAATAESLGKEVLRLCVAPGRQVEQAHLQRFLQGPPVDTVVVAHVESTTGAEAPLAELADVLRLKPEIHLLVDATESLGASHLETDRWGIDTVLASGDGALGLPHGVSFVALSPRALKRALGEGGRGNLLDLVAHQQAAALGRMLAPLAETLERAVEEGLTRIMIEEGLTSRWERQARLRALVETWVTTRSDVRLIAVPGRRSTTVSCLTFDAGLMDPEVLVRLDHAGETTVEALRERLRELERG
jgi:aspartate aminotransferase-like enzyme